MSAYEEFFCINGLYREEPQKHQPSNMVDKWSFDPGIALKKELIDVVIILVMWLECNLQTSNCFRKMSPCQGDDVINQLHL